MSRHSDVQTHRLAVGGRTRIVVSVTALRLFLFQNYRSFDFIIRLDTKVQYSSCKANRYLVSFLFFLLIPCRNQNDLMRWCHTDHFDNDFLFLFSGCLVKTHRDDVRLDDSFPQVTSRTEFHHLILFLLCSNGRLFLMALNHFSLSFFPPLVVLFSDFFLPSSLSSSLGRGP